MDDPVEVNRRRWDELVAIHAKSRFYDVEGFLGGACSLLPIELAELGDVEGKSLVHLQCHFGLDTLSWARRGAKVTGVDFAPSAIATARELAREAGLDARFVEAEVTEAAEALGGETFDVVFTSWGVLGWLPDLDAWARAVAALLAPGGTFYIVELHPTMLMFDGSDRGQRTWPYFRTAEPFEESFDGSYADRDAKVVNQRHFSWIYELGQVVTALIDAGLSLEYLHEHDGACNGMVPAMSKREDGLWRMPDDDLGLPVSFSIRARKPRAPSPA